MAQDVGVVIDLFGFLPDGAAGGFQLTVKRAPEAELAAREAMRAANDRTLATMALVKAGVPAAGVAQMADAQVAMDKTAAAGVAQMADAQVAMDKTAAAGVEAGLSAK